LNGALFHRWFFNKEIATTSCWTIPLPKDFTAGGSYDIWRGGAIRVKIRKSPFIGALIVSQGFEAEHERCDLLFGFKPQGFRPAYQ